MAIYQIEWKSSAVKELKKLSPSVIKKVFRKVNSLSDEPRPCGVRKLKGSSRSYRIRIGDYRVVYEIIDNVLIVQIVRVRHRKDVYKT